VSLASVSPNRHLEAKALHLRKGLHSILGVALLIAKTDPHWQVFAASRAPALIAGRKPQ
jgi:hypothetical protein